MRQILLFIAFSLIFSCKEKEETPSISDEQIAKILMDMSFAEAATHTLTGNEKDSLVQIYYNQVFLINKISKADHERNIRIVGRDVNRMAAIFAISDKMLGEKREK
jgi:preprotein translocase subunit Sec63